MQLQKEINRCHLLENCCRLNLHIKLQKGQKLFLKLYFDFDTLISVWDFIRILTPSFYRRFCVKLLCQEVILTFICPLLG